MSRSLSYQFEKPAAADGEQVSSNAEPITIDFNEKDSIKCVDSIDGLVALQFAAVMEPGVRGTERSRGVMRVLKSAIEPAEWTKFERLVAEYRLKVDDLIEIASDLIDVFLNHPTGPLPTSSGGQRASGTGSEENSSSEESIGKN